MNSYEICVVTRSERLTSLRESIEENFSESKLLTAREADRGALDPGIRIGTMERIKGLEFRGVAICAADQKDPLNNLEEASVNERCMSYVAATRARECLLVCLAGKK